MAQNDISKALNKLKKAKVRITPQRQAIIAYLASVDTHPTAEQIYRALANDYPNMSIATVYNTLRLFVKIGLIKELAYGDSSSHFDYAKTQHYHAICTQCGKIVDLYYPVLEDVESVANQLTGFQVSGHRLEVYGICPECQSKNRLARQKAAEQAKSK